MAKKNVVEIVCERCERTEYISPEEIHDQPDLSITLGFEGGPKRPTTDPNISVELGGTKVEFSDLCSSCKKTVKNLFDQMTKKISWKRNKGEEEVNVEIPAENGG